MALPSVRQSFMVFHAVLGLGLLIMSLEGLAHGIQEFHGEHAHLAVVSGFEAIGAALFLIPRTIRWGAAILLAVLQTGFAIHITRGEWELQLLIFAAGVWFVMVHGAEWATAASKRNVAA
jgi:uncharacterized membrane protein YphA (DoxX/SURF4 family)